MSALPFTTPSPPPKPEPPEPAPAGDRHLHAVHPDEDNTEAAPATEVPTEPDATTKAVAWAKAAFSPGSGLYTDRQPTIAEITRRAKDGKQLGENGPLRKMAKVYNYGAAANKAACLTWAWVVDHPARFAVVMALASLLLVFPATRHLLSVLLTPVVWFQQSLD
jgi:hypothetical protein